jgi:hypothetical protein
MSRRRLGTGLAIAAIVVIGLVASLWTTSETSSSAFVLT